MNFKLNKKVELQKVQDYHPDIREETLVSICVNTYNQKEYLSQCLDSILAQLVNFKVEILINDDASTDGTKELLSTYMESYPEIIKVNINKENLFSKDKNYATVYKVHCPRIKGKYVAICDSDDYYCDNLMLYKKVTLLEKHKDCFMCLSKVNKIDNTANKHIEYMPHFKLKTGIINSNKLVKLFLNSYCFQTSSYFFRSSNYIDFCKNYPKYAEMVKVFDEPVFLFFASLGKACYINNICSVYRKFSNNSWSVNKANNTTLDKINIQQQRIRFLEEYSKFTNFKYEKECNNLICHAKITILNLQNKTNDIFKDKQLKHYYRKRYFKSYVYLKYFAKK